MISNGIYVRKEPDYLVDELSGKLDGLNRIEDVDSLPPDSSSSMGRVTVYLRDREDGWCHIEMAGDTNGIALIMEFLTSHKSLEKVLVWDCNHELKEYSYTLFQRGKLLEQFSVKGPALDTVSYVSELRKVQLQDLITGHDFALEAIERFGMHPENEKNKGSRRIRLDFSLPPKRSLWQSLLGSLAGRE